MLISKCAGVRCHSQELVKPWPVSSDVPPQELRTLLKPSAPILQNLYGPVGISAATVRPGDNSLSIRAGSMAFYDKATFLDRAFSSSGCLTFINMCHN